MQPGQYRLYALERVAQALQDLEGGDVDVQRVGLAGAVRHHLRRKELPDPAVLLAGARVVENAVAGRVHGAAGDERHALALCLRELLGHGGAVDGIEDHRVGALAERAVERVLQPLRRAVGRDLRQAPTEVGRALGEDVALDLARLHAAADEDDLLAAGDGLADRTGKSNAARPDGRLRHQRLRLGQSGGGRAA